MYVWRQVRFKSCTFGLLIVDGAVIKTSFAEIDLNLILDWELKETSHLYIKCFLLVQANFTVECHNDYFNKDIIFLMY